MVQEKIKKEFITDSRMTLAEALEGTTAPPEVINALCLLNVSYYSLDGKLHRGQLVLHKGVEKDVRDIFRLIEAVRFPVAKVVPIVRYHWSDDASMADNNSSAFNYRFIQGTERLSLHALGRAVDLNPCQNPVIYQDGRSDPPGSRYQLDRAGTFSENSPIVQAFSIRGWQWGAHFQILKDYHHFQKPEVH